MTSWVVAIVLIDIVEMMILRTIPLYGLILILTLIGVII